jgi:hypothetical protein
MLVTVISVIHKYRPFPPSSAQLSQGYSCFIVDNLACAVQYTSMTLKPSKPFVCCYKLKGEKEGKNSKSKLTSKL